ncbi:MAG: hypothetical protein FWG74_07935, partial [Planctomycetes bacterium]|nr:hypothetical protein [Planctomycetota bacterium]
MTNRTSRRFLALFPSRIGIFFLLTLALSPGPVAAMDADEPGNYPAGPIVLRLPAAVDTVSWDRPEIESAAPSIPIQIRLPPIRPDLATAKAMAPETLNPRRWLRRPVQFDLERRPLPDFLRDFCAAQGVACQVSESLNGGLVTGRFAFDDPGELLDLLAHTQLMNWYFDGVVVFFQAETEMESRFFPMEGRREAGLRQTLTELGLFDERFPWRVADGGRLLMAQGPAVYLNRIAETLFRQTVADAEPTEKTLGVFRLKHAWAAEQTVGTGGSGTRVPGVADLLRRIVDDKGDALWTSPPPVASGTPQMLRGSGTVARRDAQAAAAAAPPAVPAAAPATAALAGAPFIQADARLNAVLVWDYPENLPRHQAIIEALDQPLALV